FRVLAEAGKRNLAQEPPAAISAPYADDRFDFGVQDGFGQVLEPVQVRSGKIALLFEDIFAGNYLVSGVAQDLDALFIQIGFEGARRRHERNRASRAKALVLLSIAHVRITRAFYSDRKLF